MSPHKDIGKYLGFGLDLSHQNQRSTLLFRSCPVINMYLG